MKTIFLMASLLTSQAFANTEQISRVIVSDVTHNVTLELNPTTVRCLSGGYGMESLKISVPQLLHLAAFNHTTFGETLPCINAGPCKVQIGDMLLTDGFTPDSILAKGGHQESAALRVLLEELYYINHEGQTCFRALEETVSTNVRGINFTHVNSAQLAELSYQKCVDLIKP